MAEGDKTFVINSYGSDPFARLVLINLQWKDRKLAIICTLIPLAFFYLGFIVLVCTKIHEGFDISEFGYFDLISNTIVNSLIFFIGIHFYLYFTKKSGTIYQDL